MSDRRKKARMMSESDRDEDILTLRFLMNGKVKYFKINSVNLIMVLAIGCVLAVPLSCVLENRLSK